MYHNVVGHDICSEVNLFYRTIIRNENQAFFIVLGIDSPKAIMATSIPSLWVFLFCVGGRFSANMSHFPKTAESMYFFAYACVVVLVT